MWPPSECPECNPLAKESAVQDVAHHAQLGQLATNAHHGRNECALREMYAERCTLWQSCLCFPIAAVNPKKVDFNSVQTLPWKRNFTGRSVASAASQPKSAVQNRSCGLSDHGPKLLTP